MTASATSLRWQHHEVPAAGLALDVLEDADLAAGAAGGITYLLQTRPPVALGLWVGPGMDLVGWRARLGAAPAQLGAEEQITVCGRPARRQEALVESTSAMGLLRQPEGQLGHIQESEPRRVQVGVAFSHGGQPVLVGWTVEAHARAAHRVEEQRFFASITCH